MVSLKEMVDSESNLHLNALVDWMQLLCIACPQQGDLEDWFHGADDHHSPTKRGLVLRNRQLARHAACMQCKTCTAAADSVGPA